MNHISLHGAYFPNNYGDVLILHIESEWIKEITNKEISLPYATNIYRKTLESNIEKGNIGISNSDYLIYGPGGYLGEPPKNKKIWSLYFMKNHLRPALIAARNKVPYSIVGTGGGSISTFYGRMSLRYILKHAELIAVRDNESKEYFESVYNKANEIIVTADVALSLTKESIPEKIMDKVRKKYLDYEGIKVGIHIGADRFSKDIGDQVKTVIDEVIHFFNDNTNINPILIIDNDNKIQREAVDYIGSKLNQKYSVYVHNDIMETTALLSELDTVLTNKLHIGIVNYAMGNIPISFPYHTKTKRFYKQIELEKLCIPIKEVMEGQTSSMLDNVIKDISENKKHLYQYKREEMKEKALLNKEILKKLLLK